MKRSNLIASSLAVALAVALMCVGCPPTPSYTPPPLAPSVEVEWESIRGFPSLQHPQGTTVPRRCGALGFRRVGSYCRAMPVVLACLFLIRTINGRGRRRLNQNHGEMCLTT
jgi:hypothetical protein